MIKFIHKNPYVEFYSFGSNKADFVFLKHPKLIRKEYLIRSPIWKLYISGYRNIPIQIFKSNIKLLSAYTISQAIKWSNYKNQNQQESKANKSIKQCGRDMQLGLDVSDRNYGEYINQMYSKFVQQATKEVKNKNSKIQGLQDQETVHKTKQFLQIIKGSSSTSNHIKNLNNLYESVLKQFPVDSQQQKYSLPLVKCTQSNTQENQFVNYLNKLIILSNKDYIDDIDILMLSSIGMKKITNMQYLFPTVMDSLTKLIPGWRQKYIEECKHFYYTRHYGAIVQLTKNIILSMMMIANQAEVKRRNGWSGDFMVRLFNDVGRYIQGDWLQRTKEKALRERQKQRQGMKRKFKLKTQKDNEHNYLQISLSLEDINISDLFIHTLWQYLQLKPNITTQCVKKLSTSFISSSNFTKFNSYMAYVIRGYLEYIEYLNLKVLFSKTEEKLIENYQLFSDKVRESFLVKIIYQQLKQDKNIIRKGKKRIELQEKMYQILKETTKGQTRFKNKSEQIKKSKKISDGKELINNIIKQKSPCLSTTRSLVPLAVIQCLTKNQILFNFHSALLQAISTNPSIIETVRQNILSDLNPLINEYKAVVQTYYKHIIKQVKNSQNDINQLINILLDTFRIINSVISSNESKQKFSQQLLKIIVFCFQSICKIDIIFVSDRKQKGDIMDVYTYVYEDVKKIKGLLQFIKKLQRYDSRITASTNKQQKHSDILIGPILSTNRALCIWNQLLKIKKQQKNINKITNKVSVANVTVNKELIKYQLQNIFLLKNKKTNLSVNQKYMQKLIQNRKKREQEEERSQEKYKIRLMKPKQIKKKNNFYIEGEEEEIDDSQQADDFINHLSEETENRDQNDQNKGLNSKQEGLVNGNYSSQDPLMRQLSKFFGNN